MQEKLLREVIESIAGKQAEKLIELINTKNNVSEFIIAKKLDLTINQTRNILYKLSDQGLVSSIRKKDKKKGWYTYFWKLEVLKSLEFLEKLLELKLEQINNQIKSRETKVFYVCDKCNIEVSEETALLHNFTCNECGNVFSLKDNSKVLKEFRRVFESYGAELKQVREYIGEEKGKIGKKRASDSKRFEKKKSETRRKSREESKKAREKLAKSEGKKEVKKVKLKPKKKADKKVPKKTNKKGKKK
jgi:transcription factor E